MAATDPRPSDHTLAWRSQAGEPGSGEPGSDAGPQRQRGSGRGGRPGRLAPGQLVERLDEEIGRATRYATPLCCLLVRLDELDRIAADHGGELAERALALAGEAIEAELRRFDRVGQPSEEELMVLLPGAARPQGEAVARRVLARLRAIKIEVAGTRKPLCVSVGIAAWQAPLTAAQLIDQARRAAGVTRQGGQTRPGEQV